MSSFKWERSQTKRDRFEFCLLQRYSVPLFSTVCIIRIMKSRDIIARLKKEGWTLRNVRGSHHQFVQAETGRRVTVPHPKKDIRKGTLRSIYKQAGWEWDNPR